MGNHLVALKGMALVVLIALVALVQTIMVS